MKVRDILGFGERGGRPGHVYVCGDVFMGEAALCEVEQAIGSENWAKMQSEGRVHKDVYGEHKKPAVAMKIVQSEEHAT